MIAEIPSLQEMLNNQILVGGVGTMLTGAALFVLRSIPKQIWSGIKGFTVLNLDVTTRYPEYNAIANLLGHHLIRRITRDYAPSQAKGGRFAEDQMNGGLAPGFGRGFAWYKGTFITFNRSQVETSNKLEEKMTISFLTRSTDILRSFLTDASRFNERDRLRIKVAGTDYIMATVFKEKRSFDSIFIDGSIKDKLVQRFDFFMNNEAWYKERGIPYRFCALLYGEPGTGKTSLVNAVASRLGLDIVYVTTLSEIDSLIGNCTEQDLIVIEDIDSLAKGLDRRGEDSDEKGDGGVVLHRLLNVIDGFCTPHGLKVMMTTNYKDRLDPALLRPGRTDLALEIKAMGPEEAARMFRAFYGEDLGPRATGSWKGSELQEMFVTYTSKEARAVLSAPARERTKLCPLPTSA